MATISLKDFIHKQEEEYKKCASYIKELESTLKYQHNIRTHHTIPKHYRPRPLRVMSPPELDDLNTSFHKQYEDIFYPYLSKVILHNTITLETAKAKLTNIIRQTELQLCQRDDSPEDIRKTYYCFLERNHIPATHILPQLQCIIHTPKSLTPTTHTVTTHFEKETSTVLSHRPTTTTTTPPTPTKDTHRKRKNAHPHPPPTKQPKLDHFLFRKLQNTHPPP